MIHNLLHTLPVSLIFCTIVMGFLLMYERKKHAREAKRRENNFWQRENEANFTRRKDISQLPYIKIPYDSLPFIQNAHGEIAEYQKELLSFKDSKLLNLSGLSNTDLKLMYGIATFLSFHNTMRHVPLCTARSPILALTLPRRATTVKPSLFWNSAWKQAPI